MDYKNLEYEKLIAKINEYTATSRERELTKEEAEDREEVRREYLRRIRVNMTGSLDTVKKSGGKDGGNGKKNH